MISRIFKLTLSAAVGLSLLTATGAFAADRHWVAKEAGKWSEPANWTGGVPGPKDTAVFDAGGAGNATVDAASSGAVGSVSVLAGYKGTITQERGLSVNGNMKLAGGSATGWTFAEDKPAGLAVKGNLSIALGRSITCTRSSTNSFGAGRLITVGGNLTVDGAITADGKGFMRGPGTPVLPVVAETKDPSGVQDRYVSGADIEQYKNAAPISPAGPGHGGRGAGIHHNPNGQYTVQPHSYYWTEPLGSGTWKFPGGDTYGSVTAPTSLGSGTDADTSFDPRNSYPFDAENTFWTHKGAFGGGAIKLVVGGVTTVTGRISANGAPSGETGASGGSVYIITGKLAGDGLVRANGSDGPGQGHGRGAGGGGRVAVVLKNASSVLGVILQAYGGEGRWSPAAAAGTIYLEGPKDKGHGTLVVDNRNSLVRSMFDICTSLSDKEKASYTFKSVELKNHAVLYVGKDDSLTSSSVSSRNANLLVEGKLASPKLVGLKSKQLVKPQDEITRTSGAAVTELTFGSAYTMKQELLNRSFQMSLYPYKGKIDVAGDLSTYAYQNEVAGVKTADVALVAKSGEVVSTGRLVFNDKRFGETSLDANMKEGAYQIKITLDNGLTMRPLVFDRKVFPWERNTLGLTDKIYPPFAPITVSGRDINLCADRVYTMNGFGLFDKIVSQGKVISSGPAVVKLVTASGEKSWKLTQGSFTSVKPNVVEYVAQADGGAAKLSTKSTTEFDGCAKVEMDITPGTTGETIESMYIEIPLKDSETPLMHACQPQAMRFNYAGKTPRGGQIAWEDGVCPWNDRRPPLWSVKPGTEGQNDGVIWDSRNIRNVAFWTAIPWIPYFWVGGGERGLSYFADSSSGCVLDPEKPSQQIVRQGDQLILRIYLVNKPSVVTSARRVVFGLQASPAKPMMPDWRQVDRFAIWGYMTPAMGMFCCTKYPVDRDMSLVDKLIQNGRDTKAGKEVNSQFIYDKVDTLTARGWNESMTPDAYIRRWAQDPWNQAWKNGPMKSVYFEEHWTDPGHSDVDMFGNEWAARRYLGYWPIRDKDRVVYDSPYAVEMGLTGKFINGVYPESLVDYSVYYGNEYLKRGIGLYFDNTYPHISMNPSVSDAYITDEGKIQPADNIWNQRDYYKRIWNLINYYNERGMNPPVWFSQHMTNTMIIPWTEWTTCNLDNENTWTDVARGIRPAMFPWDYALTETAGRQAGTPCHSHYAMAGKDGTPLREWGIRMVHEITNRENTEYEKMIREFGYGRDGVQVINYWSGDLSVKVSNEDVKWLAVVRKSDPTTMLVLQSWSFDPTTTKISLPGCRVWKNALTGETIHANYYGAAEVSFKDSYGTLILVGAETSYDLADWKTPLAK